MSAGRVGVAGAGTMGAGIAQLACLGGYQTVLHDPSADALQDGLDAIAAKLERGAERSRWSAGEAAAARERLSGAQKIDGLAACDLVVEAAPEDLELKRVLFARLEALCAPQAVLATNTSSLSVGAIAEGATRPERICGMHFFNPPAAMKLVEVVAADATAEPALAAAETVARDMGRTPIRCADSPGFIVNRCNRPFTLEALQILGEGVATAAEIDLIVREAGGYPMGPFELIDLIGVDVNLAVARSFHSQRALARWAPHPIQEQLVAEGRLGRKRGRGFYSYEGDAEARDARTSDPSPELRGRVLDRLLATLVNEACFAAGEGVAARSDIDLAMRLGLNHPRGPFEWGTRLGPRAVVATLEALANAGHADRYVIAPELTRWARTG